MSDTIRIEPNPELGEDCWALLGPNDEEYGAIERDDQGFTVDYGVGDGHQYSFGSFEAAERFVTRHVGDIADGYKI